MVPLALYLLAVYGLANAFTLKIGIWIVGTQKERRGPGRIPYLGEVFYCPPCLSFWIGMACSRWFLSPASALVGVWWKAMLIDGLAACGTSWLLHVTAERLLGGLDQKKI